MTNPDGPRGLARGLTNYGDADFALYLRRSFATSMGYSKAMLARLDESIRGRVNGTGVAVLTAPLNIGVGTK